MKKVLRLFFVFCLSANIAAVDAQEFKVGVIAPLSGEFANWGSNVREAMELAKHSLPEALSNKISLYFEDDQFQSAKTLSAYQDLVSSKKIMALIVVGSGAGNIIAPLAERAQLVTIAVGASDKKVAAGRTFIFTHWVDPEMEGPKMAEEIHKRGYKSVALLTQEHEGLRAISGAFQKALAATSVELVYNEYFSPETSDYRTFIPSIKSKSPDAIGLLLYPASIASFAKRAREMGVSQNIFGAETFDDKDLMSRFLPVLQGSWFASAAGGTKEFVADFQRRYNRLPGFASANGYDALKLLVSAWQSVKEPAASSKEMAAYLHSVKDFSGALGTYSATGDNRFDLPAAIMKITDRGVEPAD